VSTLQSDCRRPGHDKTGVIVRVTHFLFEQKPTSRRWKSRSPRGQELEAAVLVKAVKLCLGKRLDVYWGIVREI
jgi:formyltetrahydrofolate hydrolase